jgi:hypothetical protein
MNSIRPRWTDDVPDLYDRLADAAGFYTLAQACDYTNLSVTTIRDLLSRPRITADGNTLAPISRPAARVGESPLYSGEQLDEVRQRQENPPRRHFGGGDEPLPVLTPDESNARGLVSYSEMADLFGLHENTVRKWWSTNADFPAPKATRERRGGHPGTPTVVFDAGEVLRWLADNEKITGDTIMVHGQEMTIA